MPPSQINEAHQSKFGADGPMKGIRVLDLSAVVMGPYCTQIFSDMGASVIKLESPEGDTTRLLAPSRRSGDSGTFKFLNRGKRCISLDLRTHSGREACLDLAKTCDVFIHSMRLSALERLGLEYEKVARIHPSIVYCNLLGFGREGRYSGLAAYDDTVQAISGLASLQEEVVGHPSYIPTIVADKVTGLTAAYSVLAALLYRERTGIGQQLDVPMFETVSSFVLVEHLCGHAFKPPADVRPVYARLMAKTRQPFPTSDGKLAVVVYNDRQWSEFARLIGREDLISDLRFATLTDRSKNVDEWNRVIANSLKTRSTADWLTLLSNAGIPAMPVNSTIDLFSDPHLRDAGFFEDVSDPIDGTLCFPRFPVRFSMSPSSTRYPPGAIGEDTVAVLRDAGFAEERIDELMRSGAIRTDIATEHRR